MNIFLIGDKGQLGENIKIVNKKKVNKKNYKIFNSSRYFFSNNNFIKNEKILQKLNIHTIINTRAFTDVDRAEIDKNTSYQLNVNFVKNLSKICFKNNINLIHISSDYVYSGRLKSATKEKSKTIPVNYYGQTKLKGEKQILKYNFKYFIIRTSKIYSKEANNFVKNTLEQINLGNNLKYLDDEFFCPTYALDLVKVIFKLIPKFKKMKKSQIFNFTGKEIFTPYNSALLILKLYQKNKVELSKAKRSDFQLLAKRPKFSILDNTKIRKYIRYNLTSFSRGVKEIIGK
jgi:dTDP-4-dehydrorhamnose reductase